jgi:hypothetical protein
MTEKEIGKRSKKAQAVANGKVEKRKRRGRYQLVE